MGFNPGLDLFLYPFLSRGFHQAVRICVTIQSLEVTGGMWHKQVLGGPAAPSGGSEHPGKGEQDPKPFLSQQA